MAHWAQVDENNIVLQVIVGDNEEPDEGYSWIINNLGGTWIKTSYNNSIRKQYAGNGFTYDPEADVFICPKPFPSWSLDEGYNWKAPVLMPETGSWYWDEPTLSWIENTI